jgi:hypothetical protein
MKACIWLYESGVSDSYHDGGGVLVIAGSAEEARRRVPRFHDQPPVGEPDRIWDISAEPEVIVFRDEGCC